MTHVYLGVIIVGLILTMKVVMDSLKVIGDRKLEIGSLQASTHSCRDQIAETEKEGAELAQQIAQLQGEVEELTQREKDMQKEIKDLRGALEGGQRFKIDL